MNCDLLHVVGARPNFPKLAPVYRAAADRGLSQLIVHTGQHYDDSLSGNFFRDLEIPAPTFNLEVGSASHAVQTARIMERFEGIIQDAKAKWVVVYGDVNSTMAAALVCAKLGVRIAHVEAGLRSFDRGMPEEINRLVTDRLADLLLTPSRDADDQLLREGEAREKIRFIGNVMIDSLFHALPRAAASNFSAGLGLGPGHILVTLHRPSNVDVPNRLLAIAAALRKLAADHRLVFPIHPRTRERLSRTGVDLTGVMLIEPVDYFAMIDLERNASAVITDSGGVQEETTALGVPCFTIRDNTERPATITHGTNQLVLDIESLPGMIASSGNIDRTRRPEGWDGQAGKRAANVFASLL